MTKATEATITFTKSELLDFLKENLTVSVGIQVTPGNYGAADSVKTTVRLFLAEEEISTASDEFSLPLTKQQKNYY